MSDQTLDPRRHPYRSDLAAEHLRGLVEAARFATGVPKRVATGRAAVRAQPDLDAGQTSELLFGEVFTVYEEASGWAWGQNGADGYVGYVRAESLDSDLVTPTHRVAVPRTLLFPRPDLKAPPLDLCLSLAAPLAVSMQEDAYARLLTGGWVFAKHILAADSIRPDYAGTALDLLGAPYLWGGRSGAGYDCSGLVQIVLAAAGIRSPRDSDMQAAEVGRLISADGDDVTYRRGDLVFFPGHVAIMIDETQVVHATAFSLSVAIEPLGVVARRAGGITAVRRLGPMDP